MQERARSIDLFSNERINMNLKELILEAEKICLKVSNDVILGDYFIRNNPLERKPWHKFNYWNGWYALAKLRQSQNILEIGTGFGQSTIALARGANKTLKILVSLDLGIYGKEYAIRPQYKNQKFKWEDNMLYVQDGIEEFKAANQFNFVYQQFKVDTQDFACHPQAHSHLEQYLNFIKFDLILIDGKHKNDGCYNDLQTFFRFGDSNCLLICDDFQCIDVEKSFFRFVKENESKIQQHYIWKFLTCNTRYCPQDKSYRRDQGLIIKK